MEKPYEVFEEVPGKRMLARKLFLLGLRTVQ